MVKDSGHKFLSLVFGPKHIGLCVIDPSVGRTFLVPTLETCISRTPLEAMIKAKATMKTSWKVKTLQDRLSGLMLEARIPSLKELILSRPMDNGLPSQELYSCMEMFRNHRILRNIGLKRDSPVVYGEFVDGEFVLDPVFPLQTLQLGETSIQGARNTLNKLISVHNIGGLLMSFDQRYWNKINQYNYIEHGIRLLDTDRQLLQTSVTLVDDEGSRKKVEADVLRLYPQLAGLDTLLQEYPKVPQMEAYADRKQQLGKDLTQLRNAVRASYATGYLTDVFYRAVSKGKLQRNKRHRRKEEKMVQFAGRIGYQT